MSDSPAKAGSRTTKRRSLGTRKLVPCYQALQPLSKPSTDALTTSFTLAANIYSCLKASTGCNMAALRAG